MGTVRREQSQAGLWDSRHSGHLALLRPAAGSALPQPPAPPATHPLPAGQARPGRGRAACGAGETAREEEGSQEPLPPAWASGRLELGLGVDGVVLGL